MSEKDDIHEKDNQDQFEYVKEKIVKPSFVDRIGKRIWVIVAGVLAVIVCILTVLYLNVVREKEANDNISSSPYITIAAESASTTTQANKQEGTSEKRTDKAEEKTEKKSEESDEISKKKLGKIARAIAPSLVTVKGYENTEVKVGQKPQYITAGVVLKTGVNTLILTDYVSVDNLERLEIVVADKTFPASYKMGDKELGIAIISVSGDELEDEGIERYMKEVSMCHYSVFEEDKQVIYMGNPIDDSRYTDYGNITGQSKYNYIDGVITTIQTNITVAGNCNGFLFNVSGQLIGMAEDKIQNDAKVYVAGGIKDILPVIEKLANGVARPYMGIDGEDVTDDIIKSVGKEMPYGVYVDAVKKNSPAYVAGIRNGDIIIKAGGNEIKSMSDIRDMLDDVSVNDIVVVTIKRQDRDKYVEYKYNVKLG